MNKDNKPACVWAEKFIMGNALRKQGITSTLLLPELVSKFRHFPWWNFSTGFT
jgi:hypothetical protein